MNTRKLMASGLMALAAMFARADIYVDAAADSASADGTAEHPYATIQAAVDAAESGTTIHIAEGVYDQGGEEVADYTSARVYINGKALHLVGAGRGNTVIVGASGGEANGDGRGTGAWRCIYVNWGEGTIIEGVTLKGGSTVMPDYQRYATRSGGGLLVVGGQIGETYSDPLKVYLVDSEIIGCKAVYGGGALGGTLVRCFMEGCYADAGLAASGSRLVNCLVTRSRRAGHFNVDGVVDAARLYNCTLVDNDANYAIVNGTVANGSVVSFSSNGVASDNSTETDCVLNSSVALIAPFYDDWRLIAGSAAIGAVDVSALGGLAFPEGIDPFVDFTGATIAATAGRINAGAIQASAAAAAGGLLFETGNIAAPLIVNGRTNSFVKATCFFPEAYPTQYVVSTVAGTNAICRLARRDSSGDDKALLGFAPALDDTLCLIPPPTQGTVATNFFEFATGSDIVWTDPEHGSDNNPGTRDLPYKTLKAAVESITDFAGGGKHVIYAKKGVYDSGTMAATYGAGNYRVFVDAGDWGRLRIVAVDGPEETFIVGAPDPSSGASGSFAGCGPNAVRGVYLAGKCDVSLQGFTITGCYSLTQYTTRMNGAAVYCYNNGNENKSAQITDCVISNNYAYKSVICGGFLKRCRVEDNYSKDAIFKGREDETWAASDKIGMASFCVFANNTAEGDSGDTQGIFGGKARIYNCTVVGTKDEGRLAGGLSAFSLNTVYDGGAVLYGSGTLSNCVVYDCADTSGMSASCKVANPLFVSRSDGDYRVDKTSPCVGFSATVDTQNFWMVFDGAMDGPLSFKNGRAVVGAYQETVRCRIPGLCVFVR